MTVEEFKKLTDIHQKMLIFEDAADTLKRCTKKRRFCSLDTVWKFPYYF